MARSLVPVNGNDRVYTPPDLAFSIVQHFMPSGRMLEPCSGKGAFVHAMQTYAVEGRVDWCELDKGRDFLKLRSRKRYDWIITNPPYSLFRAFLQKSLACSDNVVFLCFYNAWFMKARQRDIKEAGFGLVEILDVPTPPHPWPQAGFALGAGWVRKGWTGSTTFSKL